LYWEVNFSLVVLWEGALCVQAASPLNEDLFALHLFLQLRLAQFHLARSSCECKKRPFEVVSAEDAQFFVIPACLVPAQASNRFPLKAANPPLSTCFSPGVMVLLHHAQVENFVPKLRTNHCGSQQWLHFRVARALLEVFLVWRFLDRLFLHSGNCYYSLLSHDSVVFGG